MKHTIAKTFAILIWAWLFAYVGRLFFQGVTVTAADSSGANITALILCGALALYILFVVFVPTMMPTNRWTLLVVGIIAIMWADIYLEDAASRQIFLKDITKLVGVFLVIIWPMKLLLSQKVVAKIEADQVEIIEV